MEYHICYKGDNNNFISVSTFKLPTTSSNVSTNDLNIPTNDLNIPKDTQPYIPSYGGAAQFNESPLNALLNDISFEQVEKNRDFKEDFSKDNDDYQENITRQINHFLKQNKD